MLDVATAPASRGWAGWALDGAGRWGWALDGLGAGLLGAGRRWAGLGGAGMLGGLDELGGLDVLDVATAPASRAWTSGLGGVGRAAGAARRR
ncbi:MAG: hypothetical protein OXC06_09720 [Acidimicrobiaceae bacterium]|nr:hypothetical protein [Acidimicrobiaceae bacterium]